MKRVALFILLLFIVSIAGAQPRFQAGLGLTLGAPQTEFKDNVDNLGGGLTGYFGYNIPNSPFIIGGNLGFLIYGSESRKVPFSDYVQEVTVDVNTTNSIFNGLLLFRVQPQQGAIRPYLDALLGFNYLFTSTDIQDERTNESIAGSTNQDDFTSCYGGGGGIMVRVYDGMDNEDHPYEVLIDFGVRYLNGGKAKYLKEGSIHRDNNGKVSYDLSESTTDLMTYTLGVAFNF